MVFTQVFTFGIYLFTNRVIAHFGSNFLKISRDFADLPVGKTYIHCGYLPAGIYLVNTKV